MWAQRTARKLHFIEPGKPTQNAYCESFNSKLRLECLPQHWFKSLNEARQVIEDWRLTTTMFDRAAHPVRWHRSRRYSQKCSTKTLTRSTQAKGDKVKRLNQFDVNVADYERPPRAVLKTSK